MINFHRRFLSKCAKVLKPLTDALTDVKNCDKVLSVSALEAFKIKNILSKAVRLSHVVPGNHLYYLAVDTSFIGVGTVQPQKLYDHWRRVSFSKSWSQLKEHTAYLDESFLQHIRRSASFDIWWKSGHSASWLTTTLWGAPSSQVLTGTNHVKQNIWIIYCNSV